MDMSRRLAEAATRRATVLLVEVPGWAATRYAAEWAVRERGWRRALSPADADVLVVCGSPGSRMAEALELAWAQLPGPRARATVTARSAVEAALDQAAAELLDTAHQRDDAAQRRPDPVLGTPADEDNDPQENDPQEQGAEDDGSAGVGGGLPEVGRRHGPRRHGPRRLGHGTGRDPAGCWR